jgi:hypothetical protein
MSSLLIKARILAYKISDLLNGEYARFIFYGAAVVVWAAVGIANALGFHRFGAIDLTGALVGATAAGAALTELIRRGVNSNNTLDAAKFLAYMDGIDAEHDIHTAQVQPTTDVPEIANPDA